MDTNVQRSLSCGISIHVNDDTSRSNPGPIIFCVKARGEANY
jgi:hypothetical protein